MSLRLITVLIALCISPSIWAEKASPTKYKIDPDHTSVGFEVPHLVISSVEGSFRHVSGQFSFDEKSILSVEAEVDADSIDTGNMKRDNHLRSPDFFNSKKYPKLLFKSSGVDFVDAKHGKLKGLLTIRDKSQPVVFDLEYKGKAVAYEKQRVAFKATTHINRKDFGLTWNDIVEAGPVVGDDITITLVVQGIRASDL